jgi:hypothetical protein
LLTVLIASTGLLVLHCKMRFIDEANFL